MELDHIQEALAFTILLRWPAWGAFLPKLGAFGPKKGCFGGPPPGPPKWGGVPPRASPGGSPPQNTPLFRGGVFFRVFGPKKSPYFSAPKGPKELFLHVTRKRTPGESNHYYLGGGYFGKSEYTKRGKSPPFRGGFPPPRGGVLRPGVLRTPPEIGFCKAFPHLRRDSITSGV